MPLNDQLVAMSEKQPWKFFARQEQNFQFLEGNFKMSEPCAQVDQTIISASLTQAGRQLDLKLIGVPIQLSPIVTPDTVIHSWHAMQ